MMSGHVTSFWPKQLRLRRFILIGTSLLTIFRSHNISSDGDSDCATDINASVQVIPYKTVRVNNAVSVTRTKLVVTVSCVKPGLICWPKPSDSRRSKQMPGIKNLKNNININIFTIVLFL